MNDTKATNKKGETMTASEMHGLDSAGDLAGTARRQADDTWLITIYALRPGDPPVRESVGGYRQAAKCLREHGLRVKRV